MLNCKEVAITLSSEDRHTWRKKVEIRLHLMICSHCRKYEKQIELLKSGIKSLLSSESKNLDKSRIKLLEDKLIEKLADKPPSE